MTRSIRSWLRPVAGATPTQRRPFVPNLLLLEDRTVPSVQFTPAPYAMPGNRPDTPLAAISATRLVEPYLSVNPADAANIAVSAQKFLGVSVNADGSLTGTATFPGSAGGDTCSTYDGAGRLFWTNLTSPGGLSGVSIAQIDPTTGGILDTHIVDRVADNSFVDDKDWIGADLSNHNLYVAWSRIGPGGLNSAHVLISYSSDQGVSWSDPVQVDNGSDAAAGAVTIAVAPDHMVYVAYHSVTLSAPDVPSHDGKIVEVRFNNDLTDPVRSIAEVPGRADVHV